MASPASSEASEIRRRGRRRLIGAIALVVLLVVFIPMVLDSEPRPSRPGPSTAIPPKESAPPLPVPTTKKEAPAKSEAPVAKPTSPASAPAPKADAATPKAAKIDAPKPGKVDTPKAAKADTPKLEGFAVQVGAFRDEDLLEQSREKLAAAGVAHYTERLDAKGGALTRLRAGPFATRAEAEAALSRLKRASIDGNVVPLP